MHPGSFWWDWIPEVLTGLRMCTCHAHGHTYFLLHKWDPVVLAHQMKPDDRLPITWDVAADAKGELAKKLSWAFAAVRLDCVGHLRAADL